MAEGARDGEPTELLRGEFDELSYSGDGEYLLADRTWDEEPVPAAARVVPAGGGDPVPVASGDVLYPAWSPEGHAIAYVEAPGTLRVVGSPNGESRELRRWRILAWWAIGWVGRPTCSC